MSTLARPVLRLKHRIPTPAVAPEPPPAPASKKRKAKKPKRRCAVVIGEPVLDELAAALAAAQDWLSDLGRQTGDLTDRAIPAAIDTLRGYDAAADLVAHLERLRALRKAENEATRRVWFWRNRHLRTIGDMECRSWEIAP